NTTERSGERLSAISSLERLGDRDSRTLSIGYGIHYFSPAIDAIAACIVFRMCSASGKALHLDSAGVDVHTAASLQKIHQRRLPNSGNDHVAFNEEIRSGYRRGDWRRVIVQVNAFESPNPAGDGIDVHFYRLRQPLKSHALLFRVLIFKAESRQLA